MPSCQKQMCHTGMQWQRIQPVSQQCNQTSFLLQNHEFKYKNITMVKLIQQRWHCKNNAEHSKPENSSPKAKGGHHSTKKYIRSDVFSSIQNTQKQNNLRNYRVDQKARVDWYLFCNKKDWASIYLSGHVAFYIQRLSSRNKWYWILPCSQWQKPYWT
jgi:hypothetical protein